MHRFCLNQSKPIVIQEQALRLKDRIALVTGAARGIGLAIAKRLSEEGARVTMADVLDAEGAPAASHLGAAYLHCDLARPADIAEAIAAMVQNHGAVDLVVNNAAISIAKDFLDVTEEDFDKVIRVNLKGAFLLTQAAARQMVKQVAEGRKPGAIVNLSSVNDTLAIPTIAPYTMSKGGVKQLTAVSALALAPHGIRVNAIGPGSIRTAMLSGTLHDKAAMNRALSRTPLGRVGEPEEIAAIAAFLASDDASYITGQVIYADGGRLPLNYTVALRED
jgi:NAD(P)-dependent dehydrogenase (short-subunit alcohol dehydrogenase family)